MPQNAFVFCGTVRENVVMVRPWDDLRYRDTIARCQMERDLEILPGGSDCEIGERGTTLSGGQQARLNIDAVTGVDSPFSFVDGLTTGITSSPALLRFALDTDGREPGTVADALEIRASDEDFVGATDQVLNLSLSVSVEPAPVECPGDLNGSGTTDVEDLLALLKGFGTLYDVDDLLVCLGDWNCSTTP